MGLKMTDPVTFAYIAVVGGSLLTGGFSNKEECYGHRDVLQEQKIYGRCVEVDEAQSSNTIFQNGPAIVTPNTGWILNGTGTTQACYMTPSGTFCP